MSYITYSVTRKDLTNYYLPKVDVYDLMMESINANTNGYGQVIYNFTTTFDNSINSFNIWDSRSQSMIIVDSNGTSYSEADAGPSLWGVTSQQGLDFLNGSLSINGLTKLKYCNTCGDRSGLRTPVVQSFSSRFTSLTEMMDDDLVDTGFLFYDFALPQLQNYYPSVYSTNISGYKFRNWQKTPKSEIQVSQETSIPVVDITDSLDNSEPIIPIKCEKVLLSYSTDYSNVCLGRQAEYEIDSDNTVIYQLNYCGRLTADVGYYYNGETVFYFDGTTLNKIGPCPSSNLLIRSCCGGLLGVIEGSYTVGTVIYTKDTNFGTCYEVIGQTSDSPNIPYKFFDFPGADCKKCTSIYPGGCGSSGSSGGGR